MFEHISHMLAYSCILHIENVDQEYVAVEEEAAAEDQEEPQLQELETVDQVEEQDPSNYTNPDPQPGKHRFIYPESYIVLSLVQAPEAFSPVSYTYI